MYFVYKFDLYSKYDWVLAIQPWRSSRWEYRGGEGRASCPSRGGGGAGDHDNDDDDAEVRFVTAGGSVKFLPGGVNFSIFTNFFVFFCWNSKKLRV